MGAYDSRDTAAWENQAAAHSYAYPPSYTAVPYAPDDPTPGVYDTRVPPPSPDHSYQQPEAAIAPPYAQYSDVPAPTTYPPSLHRNTPAPAPVPCAYCGTIPASATGVIWLGVDDPRHEHHHTQQAFCSAVHAGWYMVERHPEGRRGRAGMWHDPAGVGDQGFVAAWADDGEELPVVAPVVHYQQPPPPPPQHQWASAPRHDVYAAEPPSPPHHPPHGYPPPHGLHPPAQRPPAQPAQQWATPQWTVHPAAGFAEDGDDDETGMLQGLFSNEAGEILPVLVAAIGLAGATIALWILYSLAMKFVG